MKKALSLILVCLFLVSMIIPVSAAQFINAYETIQAENYSEASCASVNTSALFFAVPLGWLA